MKLNWCVCQVSSDSGYVSYRIPAWEDGSHMVRARGSRTRTMAPHKGGT